MITRKGGKVVTIPLAPRTARAIDLATGERSEGPLYVAAGGRRLDRHGPARVVRRVTRRAGISKHVSPHTLRSEGGGSHGMGSCQLLRVGGIAVAGDLDIIPI